MADKQKKPASSRRHGGLHLEGNLNEFQRLLNHVQENPLLYAASAAFIAVCVLAGVFFRINREFREKQAITEYAEVIVQTEDPAKQAEELRETADGNTIWDAEALYMAGEKAIEAGKYDDAQSTFRAAVEQFPDSPYAPRAWQGLGFLAENRADYEEALEDYRKVFERWPGSLPGKRIMFRIGRVQEAMGDLEKAIASYQSQQSIFPDSRIALEAERALSRLRTLHPDLFPEEEEETVQLDTLTVEDSAEETPAEETPAEETPAEETPAEEAPAEEAPAEEAPAAN
jgi:TolA-binding protein